MTPRQLNANISPQTEAIILKAMENEPKDRFQTAAEMYQAILDSGVASITNARPITSNPLPHIPPSGPFPSSPTMPQTPNTPVPPQPSSGNATLAGAILGASNQGKWGAAPVGTPPPPTPPAPPSGISRRNLLIGGGIAAILLAGGTATYLTTRNKSANLPATTKPVGTIVVPFTYSTEKDVWIKTAVTAFNKSNTLVNQKAVQVLLDGRGSGEAQTSILNGTIQPVAWSPASTLELNQLSAAWKQKNNGQDIIATSNNAQAQSLVFSPLVFAVWKDRAQVLLSQYGRIDWSTIHDALVLKNGWPDIKNGRAEWGVVKFGQTRPDKSNSGLLSIILLAYSYHKIERGLTTQQIQDAGFLKYFTEIEGAVTQFGQSSGTYLTNEVILKGSAAYDITTTYENLVLTNEKVATQRQGQSLQPFYPGLNIVSDHPFAILNGSWVTPEARDAAIAFRDFLLAEAQQRQALLSGFRPTNLNVSIKDNIAGNPFRNQSSDIQIPDQIQRQAQPPGGEVVNALIQQWLNQYQNAATSNS